MISIIIFSIILLALIVIFISAERTPRVKIFPDGIVIKDTYGAVIPNNTILSIRLIDQMPKVLYRSFGTNSFCTLKGFCRLRRESGDKHTEKVLLFLRKPFMRRPVGPVIEINTVNGFVYINRSTEEATRALFDEMSKIVVRVSENEINHDYKRSRLKPVLRILNVIFIIFAITIATVFFVSKSTRIHVDMQTRQIEISGIYGVDIQADEVVAVHLLDTIPTTSLRVNAASFAKKKIGDFLLKDGDTSRFFIQQSETPPFIELKTKTRRFYLNLGTSEETQSAYNQIVKLVE